MLTKEPTNPVSSPLLPQFSQRLIMINNSVFCVGITLFIISIIMSFILFAFRRPPIPLVIFDLIVYIITLIYCSFTYGFDVWIDMTNRVISIRKRSVLRKVTYCCPKKYSIDDIKEFSLEGNKNGELRKK